MQGEAATEKNDENIIMMQGTSTGLLVDPRQQMQE